MLKGRKVTEPVVQQRTGSTQQYNTQGIGGVGGTTDVHLHATGETSITHYAPNTTYSLPEHFPSQTVVDNYGRSSHLKAKYQHDRRNDGKHVKTSEKKKGTNEHGISAKSRKSVGQNGKRVEFSTLIHEHRPSVLDNGYNGGVFEPSLSDDDHEQSTLTTSRDIRETEINFLNNNLTRTGPHSYDGLDPPGTRLTHVSVTVPGSSSHRATSAPSRQAPVLQLVSHNTEMAEMPSDSESNSHPRKFKGLKHIDPDGLAKIKETIRKQQQSRASPTNKENAVDVNTDLDAGQPRSLHYASDPILPQPQDPAPGEKVMKQRKVAAGPSAPTYKGFSEAEVKYRIVEPKAGKSLEGTASRDKKKVSLKLQEKRPEPLGSWLNVEEGDGRNKKVTRVIAPSRKHAKQQPQPKQKELITTSSWRAGQELILRELGPARGRRSSSKSGTRDTAGHAGGENGDEHLAGHIDMEQDDGDDGRDDEYVGATASELQHHKALSEEARKVYTDLHLHQPAPDHDSQHTRYTHSKDYKWKAPTKRKAPKVTDVEKHSASSAKQRHYDADQIRRYMQRQKADRVRRQREAEQKHREEEESRRRQLDELRSKQKQVSVHSASVGKKIRQRQPLESLQLQSGTGGPLDYMEADNLRNMHEEEMSDSSSTITGDGSEDNLPTQTRIRVDVERKDRASHNGPSSLGVTGPARPAPNLRSRGAEISFDVNDVTSKFSRALQEKLQEEPRGIQNAMSSDDRRSRSDRIQAIKDTAATLQNRLKEEARRIQATSTTGTDSGVKQSSGASSRPAREPEFMSRYEQVTAANTDFTVFKANLPGNQMASVSPADPVGPSSARVAPVGSSRPGVAGGPREEYLEDTETSTFSEITLTDESDNEDMPTRKVGDGLRQSETHAASKPAPLSIPRPSTDVKPRVSWDDPSPDDYNVFSIYSRRAHERITRPGREPMSRGSKKHSETDQRSSASRPSGIQSSRPSGVQTTRPSVDTIQPAVAGLSSAGRLGGKPESALRTRSPVTTTTRAQAAVGTDSEEEMQSEPSYTPTFITEESVSTRGKSVSEKSAVKSTVKSAVKSASSVQSKHSKSPGLPEPADADQDSSISEDLSQEDVTPRAEKLESEPAGPARLSPNALEQRFYAAFNNLETMELSLKQLNSVDRTRAVSMAQQETVSLAQMLKARQQGYEVHMKEIQIKAQQEATEATKQLEDARKRASDAAINAADMIAKVRGETTSTLQESTRKLIDTQTQAAKATAEAAKFLSEARNLHDSRSGPGASGGAKPKTTDGKGRSDEGRDNDDVDSVASLDDYSIDHSLTEDEREEKSYRLLLPSESHRKRKNAQHSDNESVTSEASSRGVLDHDLHRLFAGEEGGFDKFTEDMVRQFMKEEELRAQHQASLLRLRENALVEKTKTELQWLKQQKMRMRNKGADDSYPQLRKKQLGLSKKLEEQQQEIRRLKEENKAAAKERQRQLYQQISKRAATTTTAGAGASTGVATGASRGPGIGSKKSGRRPNEAHTEAEVSSIDEASDVEKSRKTYKSDSEIYTDSTPRTRKSDAKSIDKYKKLHLDEKYLTQRQSRLMERRQKAEELLKWKEQLDREEVRVHKLERKARRLWETKEKEGKKDGKKEALMARDEHDKPSTYKDTNGTTKESTIKTVSVSKGDRDTTTQISEAVTTARDESLRSSIQEDVASVSAGDETVHSRRMNDRDNMKQHHRSGSESSVMEEIQSVSSDSKKLNDSSDETMTPTYDNTFTGTATSSRQQKPEKDSKSKSPLEKLRNYGLASPRSPRALFSSRSVTRTSESESEDSVSIESQSELSDFEGRIRDLNEKLRHRKIEADKLKKRKRRDQMKNKEETLKKQIEAYDTQINSLKTELKKEITQEPKSSVRPQIKQPRVSPPKTHQKPEPGSAPSTPTKAQPGEPTTQGEKSGLKPAAGLDRISEGSESKSERSEFTYRTDHSEPKTDRSDVVSMRSDRSESAREKIASMKELINEAISDNDISEEIEEEAGTEEASDDRTKEEIQINLKQGVEDLYDVTVSEKYEDDFTGDQTAPYPDKSFRSHMSDFDSKTVPPHSARSMTEAISEQISEHVGSMAGDDSFIQQLDLKLPRADEEEAEKLVQEESDVDISHTSRPSSGKSERSLISTEHESSESERSPKPLATRLQGFGVTMDIDDLLGPMDEPTPQPSPPSTPAETPRMVDSESSRATSNFYEPLADFEIGDRITVTGPDGNRVAGRLLFRGNVQFAPGVWAGVELETAQGRHNGIEDGVRYFTCRDRHGLIVPGNDLRAAQEEEEDADTEVNVRESMSSINTEDGDLLDVINEAARNVEHFDEQSPQLTPRQDDKASKASREQVANKITDDLLKLLVNQDLSQISNIAAEKQASRKRQPPPVAPKPSKPAAKEPAEVSVPHHDTDVSDQVPAEPQHVEPDNAEEVVDSQTETAVSNMMNEAIEKMLQIRQQQRGGATADKVLADDAAGAGRGVADERHVTPNDSGVMEEEEESAGSPASPTAELEQAIGKEGDSDEEDDLLDAPLRPGSPVPGQHTQLVSHIPKDDSGLDDYEEELWTGPNKAPPPYPSSDSGSEREYRRTVEEVFYAVPHDEQEVNTVVSSAVDAFWEQRRYGEPLADLQPTEEFYTHEEIGSDLISNSRRVFKKLLFDLSGEIIRNIYQEEELDSPVAWHKPKRKTNKFYRGASPPHTVDLLRPVVQRAVVDILGLNGGKKSGEKGRWGIRKKKDLVDSILVQELREEEPEWINYDDDELAVKMQLTDTIFHDLLTDTVQTMNKIFRKKLSLQEHSKAAK